MTLRARLIVTVTGIALLLVLPALFAVKQLERVRDIAATQAQRVSRANLALGRFQARLAELDRLQRSYIIAPDAETRGRMHESLGEARRHLANLGVYGYGELARPAGAWLDSIQTGTERIDELMVAGRVDEATTFFEEVKPLYLQAEATLSEIADGIDVQSRGELREAEQISAAAMTTTLLALTICLLLAVSLGLYTTRRLSRPILLLRRAMSGVAAGEFVVPEILPYDRSDEIGDVSRSFRAMTQRLAELDRMKAEFMSIATHELKTPINVIGGYAELMQEKVYGDVSEAQDEALISIREQTQILTSLVNQLLDISRLEAGGLQLEMNIIDVGELLDRIERSFGALAQKNEVTFAVDVESSIPERIVGDAERIRDQVLGNLLSNAVKFTPAGGTVKLRAWGDADALRIEVTDTGSGIPGDKLPYIFDKFYQIGEQARSQGAGLGLAIAREVVDAHGGTIEVASEPGEGTTFRLSLPTDRPATPAMTPAHHAREPIETV